MPIEVSASDSLAALAATWMGQYSSDASGRQGSIVFDLRAGDRAAIGDVVMFSTVVANPTVPRDHATGGMTPSASVLKISFVRVAGGEVSGRIDPYADPVTGAGSGVAPQRGRWKVTRK